MDHQQVTEEMMQAARQAFAASGGKARAKALTPRKRTMIARQAATARWGNRESKGQEPRREANGKKK